MAGGATYNYHTTWSFDAKDDISDSTEGTGDIYKVVNGETATIANSGFSMQSVGILTIPANSGDTATYADAGKIKFTAGLAISSAGLPLTVMNSGYVHIASDGTWAIGKSLSAVASGIVAEGLFNFATAFYVASGGAIF